MTPDEERQRINARWEQIDGELASLGLRNDLGPSAVQDERDRLLGEQDELEYRLGELYFAERH